ncbi:MAG: hypothetical protein R2766_10160 [Saprospiraceae bacterium]
MLKVPAEATKAPPVEGAAEALSKYHPYLHRSIEQLKPMTFVPVSP